LQKKFKPDGWEIYFTETVWLGCRDEAGPNAQGAAFLVGVARTKANCSGIAHSTHSGQGDSKKTFKYTSIDCKMVFCGKL
jgi:hypothetical protein